MNFLSQGFEKLEHYRETDRQTDATKNITTLLPAFAGDNNFDIRTLLLIYSDNINMMSRISYSLTTTIATLGPNFMLTEIQVSVLYSVLTNDVTGH